MAMMASMMRRLRGKTWEELRGPAVHLSTSILVLILAVFTNKDVYQYGFFHTLSPSCKSTGQCAVAAVSCLFDLLVLFGLTQFLYILCVLMDPGFLTPGVPSAYESKQHLKEARTKMITWDSREVLGAITEKPHPPLRILPELYCHLCDVYIPVRGRHCLACRRCVSKFDHHCPWVGQCVARLNHRVFVAFLFAQCFLLQAACLMFWAALTPMDAMPWLLTVKDLVIWLWVNKFALGSLFICVLSALTAAPLAFGHGYLMMVEQTTWEFIRGQATAYLRYFPGKSPFHRGYFTNIRRNLAPSAHDCAILDAEDTDHWWKQYEKKYGSVPMTESV